MTNRFMASVSAISLLVLSAPAFAQDAPALDAGDTTTESEARQAVTASRACRMCRSP